MRCVFISARDPLPSCGISWSRRPTSIRKFPDVDCPLAAHKAHTNHLLLEPTRAAGFFICCFAVEVSNTQQQSCELLKYERLVRCKSAHRIKQVLQMMHEWCPQMENFRDGSKHCSVQLRCLCIRHTVVMLSFHFATDVEGSLIGIVPWIMSCHCCSCFRRDHAHKQHAPPSAGRSSANMM